MKRTKIKDILAQDKADYEVVVKGWVRSFRNNQFIALNDGSCMSNLQIVVDDADLKITPGAAMSVKGQLIHSQGKGQRYEIKAAEVEILGVCEAEQYPLQLKNRPSLEYLREQAHLRFRTNTFGAVFRVRHALAFAVHAFFHQKGFVYLHTPIITSSDAEGAGEMFRVTTLPLEKLPTNEDGTVDFKEDFFEKSTHLTVSGQLEAELGAMALGEVYTFGPTFRAENSNTARHLAEFWMIEPEVAFNDLKDNMDLAEAFIKYIIQYVLDNNKEDLEFLNQRLADEEKQKPQNERGDMTLLEKLDFVVKNDFERISYTQAIDILMQSKPLRKNNSHMKYNGG